MKRQNRQGDQRHRKRSTTPYGVALYNFSSAVRIVEFSTGRSIHFAELRFSKLYNIAQIPEIANLLPKYLMSAHPVLTLQYQKSFKL